MIVKLYPGANKLIRVGDMKTADLIVERPISKPIFLLFLKPKIVMRN